MRPGKVELTKISKKEKEDNYKVGWEFLASSHFFPKPLKIQATCVIISLLLNIKPYVLNNE